MQWLLFMDKTHYNKRYNHAQGIYNNLSTYQSINQSINQSWIYIAHKRKLTITFTIKCSIVPILLIAN